MAGPQTRTGIFFFVTILLYMWGCLTQQSKHRKGISSVFQERKDVLAWISEKWDGRDCIVLDGKIENSENKLIVYSSWNNDSLFFYFKVFDSDLRTYQTDQDHFKLFLDDMVEVLLDSNNDKDSCWDEDDIVYHINLFGVKKDDRGNRECLTNPKWNGNGGIIIHLNGTLNDTLDIDNGYLMSLSFPWLEIGKQPKDGLRIGVNFANGDNDGKGRQLFDWVGALPMRSPYAFGDLVLRTTNKH